MSNEVTAEDVKAVFGDSPAQSPNATAAHSDADVKSVFGNTPQPTDVNAPRLSQAKGDPLTSTVAKDTWSQAVSGLDIIGKGYRMGEDDLHSAIGWSGAVTGQISDEEAKRLYNPTPLQLRRSQSMASFDNEPQDVMHNTLWATKSFFSSIPYLQQMAADSTVLGATGLVGGAAVGAATGSEAGAVTLVTPLAPAAAITVPGGAIGGGLMGGMTGGAWGIRAGVAKTAFQVGAGSMYRDLINKGVDRKTALPAAVAAGTAGAVLQSLFLQGAVMQKQALNAGTEIIKKTLLTHALDLTKTVAGAVVTIDLQKAIDYAIEHVVATIDAHETPPTFDQMKEGLAKSTIEGTLLGAGAHALHLAAGQIKLGKGGEPESGPVESAVKEMFSPAPKRNVSKVVQLRLQGEIVKQETKFKDAQGDLAEAKALDKETAADKEAQRQERDAKAKERRTELSRPSAGTKQAEKSLAKAEKDLTRLQTEHAIANQTFNKVNQLKLQGQVEKQEQKVKDTQERLDESIKNDEEALQKFDDAEAKRKEKEDFGNKPSEKTLTAQARVDREKENLDVLKTKHQIAVAEHAVSQAEAALLAAHAKGEPLDIPQAELDLARTKLHAINPVDTLQGVVVKQRTITKKEQEKKELETETTKARKEARHAANVALDYENKLQQQISYGKKPTDEQLAKRVDLAKQLEASIEYRDKKEAQLKKREEADKEQARNAIDRTLEKAADIQVVKGKTALIDMERRRLLMLYKDGIDNPDKVANFFNTNPPVPTDIATGTEADTEKATVYGQVAGYKNMNATQLQALQGNIEGTWNEGRIAMKEKEAQQKEERDAWSLRVEEAVRGGRTDQEIALFKADKSAKKKLIQGYRSLGHTVSVWRMNVDMITQLAPKDEREAIKNKCDFTREELDAQDDINYWVRRYDNMLSDGSPVQLQAVNEFLNKSNEDINFGTYHGIVQKKGLYVNKPDMHLVTTWGRLINLYNQFQDPDLFRGFQTMGYTFDFTPDFIVEKHSNPSLVSTQQLIKQTVENNPIARKIAQTQMDFYQEFGENYASPAHERITGMPLNLDNKLYSGYAARDIKDSPENLNLLSSVMDKVGLTPNSAIDRVDNALPLKEQDATTKLVQHITEYANFNHMTEKARLVTAVLNNRETRRIINDTFPDSVMVTVDNAYSSIIGTRTQLNNAAYNWLDKLRNTFATAATAGKASSAFKQMTAYVYFGFYMPQRELHEGIAYATAHPGELKTFLESSKLYRNRGTDLARQALNNVRGEASVVENKYTEKTMGAIEFGDKAAFSKAGFSYYRYLLSQGKTPDEAMTLFEQAATATQSSSNVSQQTEYERAGAAGKAATLFKKQGIQTMGHVLESLRDVANNPTKENAKEAAKRVGIALAGSWLFKAVGKISAYAFYGSIGLALGRQVGEQPEVGKFINEVTSGSVTDQVANIPMLGTALEATVGHAIQKGVEVATGTKAPPEHEPSAGVGFDQIAHGVKAINLTTDALIDGFVKGDVPSFSDIATWGHEVAQSFGAAKTGLPVQQFTQKAKVILHEESGGGSFHMPSRGF